MPIYTNKSKNTITKKILVFFIVTSAIFAISISLYIINRFRDNIKAFYGDIGTKVGNYLISKIDSKKISHYVETREPDDYYKEIEELFTNTKNQFDVAMLYLMVPIDEGILYIWDVGYENPDPFGMDDYNVYANDIRLSGTEHVEIANYRVATSVAIIDGKEEYVYEDKQFATVLVPYLSETGKVEYYIGIDFDMKDINLYINDFTIKEIGIILLVFLMQTIIIILFIKFSVSEPLSSITKKMRETLNKNSYSSNVLSDVVSDSKEITNITHSLNKISEIIEKYNSNILKNLLDDTQANFAISTMRKFKSEELLKPSVFYDEDKRYKLCIYMEKIDEENKDYYSYFNIGEDKVAFILMESSEKSEAFSMTLDAISKYIKNKSILGEDIGVIFTNLSKFLHLSDWVGIYVNCCEIIIDFNTGEVDYVNAGLINSARYIKKEDTYKDLPFERENSLSATEDPIYVVNHFKVEKDDRLLFYTSKLNELLGLKADDYSSKEIVKYMNQNKNLDLEALFNKMKETININKQKVEIQDMIFMIVEKC